MRCVNWLWLCDSKSGRICWRFSQARTWCLVKVSDSNLNFVWSWKIGSPCDWNCEIIAKQIAAVVRLIDGSEDKSTLEYFKIRAASFVSPGLSTHVFLYWLYSLDVWKVHFAMILWHFSRFEVITLGKSPTFATLYIPNITLTNCFSFNHSSVPSSHIRAVLSYYYCKHSIFFLLLLQKSM